MEVNVDDLKQNFNEWLQQLNDFFSRLAVDEEVAFGAIGVGFLFLIIGLLLL